ncbi:hypothetical protein PC123_g8645 [Phytophthora cactorum]|nr:hypothetical protein PC123_g8645 [Phytophthora cactorum]
MAKSKRTGRELQLRLASLKYTYGKQLSNFPPCFFGGSSPTPPSFFWRGRSGGRRQGQIITKLGGAGSRGGRDSCGISQGPRGTAMAAPVLSKLTTWDTAISWMDSVLLVPVMLDDVANI